MALEDDPWVIENSAVGAARLHALGSVAINWNRCEYWFHAIFTVLLSKGDEVSRIILHDLGPKTIWAKIIDLAKNRNIPPDLIDALKYAAQLSDANRANRNLMIHADVLPNNRATEIDEVLKLVRRKGETMRYNDILCSVTDIRRVSDEILALRDYLQNLCIRLALLKVKPQPLPDRPPLPKSMVLPDPLRDHGKPSR